MHGVQACRPLNKPGHYLVDYLTALVGFKRFKLSQDVSVGRVDDLSIAFHLENEFNPPRDEVMRFFIYGESGETLLREIPLGPYHNGPKVFGSIMATATNATKKIIIPIANQMRAFNICLTPSIAES